MDIKEYISSGIVETYVLGLASVAETKEIETLAVQHPEIREAIAVFEEALEKEALANAVTPPPMLRERVMEALAREGLKSGSPVPTQELSAVSSSQPAKVISITAAPKSVRWLRGAIAASIILLLGSAILNFYFYSQYKKYSNQYSSLLAQNASLITENTILNASYDMLSDTSVKQVVMRAAKPETAGMMATVVWDMKSKDVWLMVNNLPKPKSKSKQYQLWALVGDKKIDAGVFDTDNSGLIKLKNIPNAEAFAVTLEDRGGSPAPHLEELKVLGKV